MLNDENIAHMIKEALGEKAKSGFLTAVDLMKVMLSQEIQDQLVQARINRPSIVKSTACWWLGQLGWHMGDTKMACMSMAMNVRMLWNIEKNLWTSLKHMSIDFTPGIMRGRNCHLVSLWLA